MNNLFSTQEAAKFLGVTTRAIRKWKARGKITPVKTDERGYDFYTEEQLRNIKGGSIVPNPRNVPNPVPNPRNNTVGDTVPKPVPNTSFIQAESDNTTTEIQRVHEGKKITPTTADDEKITNTSNKNTTELLFGQLPHENFDDEYLQLIKLDIAKAQAHLDELSEADRRGLTLSTLRHFHCGYLLDWVLTKSRAELACGLYINKDTGEKKHLPPPSHRIIIPTAGNFHFNAVATPSARQSLDKRFWKQHAGKMTLFFDTDKNLDSDTIFIVEGEFDAMSIWQASAGKIAVAAILGCDNWKRTLLPKLPDLHGKRLILLLDADAAGNKAAKQLLDELLQRGIPAVRKSLFDALHKQEQNYFGHKVDANDLLKARGDEYLNQILSKIIDSAAPEFDSLLGRVGKLLK